MSISDGANALQMIFTGVGAPANIRLLLGLVNYGPNAQSATFDDFECDFDC